MRAIAMVAACAAMIVGLAVVTPDVQRAEAASGSDFKPGYIIDDSKFFARDAMSVDEIQGFLNAKVPRCAAGATCLKNYTEVTHTIGATPMCSQYDGGWRESAAMIIWKIQQTCGVSAKALIVTLQKEQGLITSTSPSDYAYRSAMGAGCPDTAACDSNYYGFFNQLHYGAFLLRRYTQPAGTGPGTPWDTRFDLRYPVGRVTNILKNPNAGCGTIPVFVANQATHALYIYTPYTPDGPALANVYGTGGDCSSYGNRNFWRYYTDWFGPTTGNDQPVGNIEGLSATGSGIQVSGWALDPNSPDPIGVKVTVDGVDAARATADGSRPDVQSVFPGTGPRHGFSISVPTAEGTHAVCVSGLNVGAGADALVGCRTIEVHYALPWGSVEGVALSDIGARFSGWAIDPNTTGPVLLHVYVDGALADGFLANTSRPDVGAAYPGTGSSHGFGFDLPLAVGSHSVCIYAINVGAGSGNPPIGCPTVVVPTRTPRGSLDAVGTYAQGVTVSGWALDPSTSDSVNTHVYIDGRFAQGVPATSSRPDVAAAFPRTGANHGFAGQIPTGDGTHSVCVYALNIQSDKNLALGCRTVTLARPTPTGRLDSVRASAGYADVSGWSFDQGAPAATNFVHIYSDGQFVGGFPADSARADVGAAYPSAGGSHGFGGRVWIGGGLHTVCAYGLSTIGGGSSSLGCVSLRGA